MRQWHTKSVEETEELGRAIGATLNRGSIVCLFGELATGKTSFIKGLAAAKGCAPSDVSSPTFVYLHIYEGSCALYHFDLYRLTCARDFLERGFEEYFYEEGICCIEWAERIEPLLPKEALCIRFEHAEDGRTVTFFHPFSESAVPAQCADRPSPASESSP